MWYLLTVILGAIGLIALLRVGERLALGGGTGSVWVQLLIGLLCIVGAWKSLQKARGK